MGKKSCLSKPDAKRVELMRDVVWSAGYTPMKRSPLWESTGKKGSGWGRTIAFTALEVMGYIIVDKSGFVYPNKLV